jgi:hypothetical protein
LKRKNQPKQQDLIKRIESSLHSDKKAFSYLERVKNQVDVLKMEKEKAENMVFLLENLN